MVANLALLLLFLLVGPSATMARPLCPETLGQCMVAGGFYRAEVPETWDGQAPLPAVVHFHGFREDAGDLIARQDLQSWANARGILLVVPQGAGQTWSHPGSPSQLRDDFAFTAALLADLHRRVPIDEKRLFASGFSQGASMLWALACYRGDDFRLHLTIAGAFWRPEPTNCPAGQANIRHIHGLADQTVPLEGRPIRGGQFHQGRVAHALALQRTAGACEIAEKDDTVVRRALTCWKARGCQRGAMLEFCLHPGTHDFDPSWLDEAFMDVSGMAGEALKKR
ncbi:LpqC Poly(3-hydroxybutyrate) depolymerase [Rhabdaerophilaceae bacterium]